MRRFNNILYCSRGIDQEQDSLSQALFFVKHNQANLNILILYPRLPKDFDAYRNSYEESLLSNIRKTIKQIIDKNHYNDAEIHQYINYRIEACDVPVTHIVQHVLRDQYDLVMKRGEIAEGKKGFKAIDMGLIRKCPCPVWLYHPSQDGSAIKHIAVAIDPESPEISGVDLAEHLLRLGHDLSTQTGARLSVVSCWNYAYEETIRGSDFAAIPEPTLNKIVADAKDVHLATLQTIIQSAKIGNTFNLQHVKGLPSTLIPEFVQTQGVDLLIMGSLARTGIPGFLMGNTAEDILQKIECTSLTLKPAGFVSPVKPFS